ncbi:MAG TPA: hypothetical protein VH120_15400 [Gemmataceae bacterium]|jgi:hypothetical protein|nr:hypothetical protein [Gemmataceae bacterium]
MRGNHKFLIPIACILVFQATGSPQTLKSEPARPAHRYATPTAVFDAYRVAIAKKDAATEMYCQVKEIREDAYQMFVGGGYAAAIQPEMAPGIAAVIKKFGADGIYDEHTKRFKAKHGYDPVKAQAEYEAKMNKTVEEYRKKHPNDGPHSDGEIASIQPLGGPPNQIDEELLRAVVNAKIADKVGFVIAMQEATRDVKFVERSLGPLKNIRIHGNTATGVATETMKYNDAGPGAPAKIGTTTSESSFFFRKTPEGWLIGYPVGAEIPAPIAPQPVPPPGLG